MKWCKKNKKNTLWCLSKIQEKRDAFCGEKKRIEVKSIDLLIIIFSFRILQQIEIKELILVQQMIYKIKGIIIEI